MELMLFPATYLYKSPYIEKEPFSVRGYLVRFKSYKVLYEKGLVTHKRIDDEG